MAGKECSDCMVRDLQKLHRLMERRITGKLPEEVREPLMEAKKQLHLALRGVISYGLREEDADKKKHPGQVRSVKVD